MGSEDGVWSGEGFTFTRNGLNSVFENFGNAEQELYNLINSLRTEVLADWRKHWSDPYGEKMLSRVTKAEAAFVGYLKTVESQDKALAKKINSLYASTGATEKAVDDTVTSRQDLAAWEDGGATSLGSGSAGKAGKLAYDINIDYAWIDTIGARLKRLSSECAAAEMMSQASAAMPSAGKWEGHDEEAKAFQEAADKIKATLGKLGKMGDMIARVVEAILDTEDPDIVATYAGQNKWA